MNFVDRTALLSSASRIVGGGPKYWTEHTLNVIADIIPKLIKVIGDFEAENAALRCQDMLQPDRETIPDNDPKVLAELAQLSRKQLLERLRGVYDLYPGQCEPRRFYTGAINHEAARRIEEYSAKLRAACAPDEPGGIMAGNPNGPMGAYVRAELERQLSEMPDKFAPRSRVRKIKGYKFEGFVCGSFPYLTRDGIPDMSKPKFVNVQHDDGWVMHFRENELEAVDVRD